MIKTWFEILKSELKSKFKTQVFTQATVGGFTTTYEQSSTRTFDNPIRGSGLVGGSVGFPYSKPLNGSIPQAYPVYRSSLVLIQSASAGYAVVQASFLPGGYNFSKINEVSEIGGETNGKVGALHN